MKKAFSTFFVCMAWNQKKEPLALHRLRHQFLDLEPGQIVSFYACLEEDGQISKNIAMFVFPCGVETPVNIDEAGHTVISEALRKGIRQKARVVSVTSENNGTTNPKTGNISQCIDIRVEFLD